MMIALSWKFSFESVGRFGAGQFKTDHVIMACPDLLLDGPGYADTRLSGGKEVSTVFEFIHHKFEFFIGNVHHGDCPSW
jgi:hypothetical protein